MEVNGSLQMGHSQAPSSVAFQVEQAWNHLRLQEETGDLEQHAGNCLCLSCIHLFRLSFMRKSVHNAGKNLCQVYLQIF